MDEPDGTDSTVAWPEVMSIPQMAAYLQISEWSARELCRQGKVASARIAVRSGNKSSIRIRREWIDGYLDRQAADPPAGAPKPRIARPPGAATGPAA